MHRVTEIMPCRRAGSGEGLTGQQSRPGKIPAQSEPKAKAQLREAPQEYMVRLRRELPPEACKEVRSILTQCIAD